MIQWIVIASQSRSFGLVRLMFYGPVNTIKAMLSRSVYLTTLFLGRLSLLCVSTCAHSFTRNWQLPFLNQRKRENDCRKYFTSNLPERMLLYPSGIEPAISWSPVGWTSDWAKEAFFFMSGCRCFFGNFSSVEPFTNYNIFFFNLVWLKLGKNCEQISKKLFLSSPYFNFPYSVQ